MYIVLKKIWIKITNWEYWPIYIVNIPIFFIYAWYAIKAKSFTFFTLVNPNIPTGGLFGESKWDIYQLLPEELYPQTRLVNPHESLIVINKWIIDQGLYYPIICKPDIGERGYKVEIVKSENDLVRYMSEADQDFLIQEYIDYPIELSVVAYSIPTGDQADVTSICYKEPLSVVGNGKSTLRQLIIDKSRALLQLDRLKPKWGHKYQDVLRDGEKIVLENIGNHSKGSKFIDWNDRKNDIINDYFIDLIESMDEVHFGRFDLKCASEADFLKARNIKIIEFNGVGGEPAHAYDPRHSFFNLIKTMKRHWGVIFDISQKQKNTTSAISLKEGYQLYKSYKLKVS